MGFKKMALILFSDLELILILIKFTPREITWCSRLPAVLLVTYMNCRFPRNWLFSSLFTSHWFHMCASGASHGARCDTRGVVIPCSSQFRMRNPPFWMLASVLHVCYFYQSSRWQPVRISLTTSQYLTPLGCLRFVSPFSLFLVYRNK